jgi:hypothetical protein
MSDTVTVYYPTLTTPDGELSPFGSKLATFLREHIRTLEEKGQLEALDEASMRYYVLRSRQRFTPAQSFAAMPPEMQQKVWEKYFFSLDPIEREAVNVEVMQAYQGEETNMTNKPTQESAPSETDKALYRATVQLREGARELEIALNEAIPPRAYESAEDWLARMKRLGEKGR